MININSEAQTHKSLSKAVEISLKYSIDTDSNNDTNANNDTDNLSEKQKKDLEKLNKLLEVKDNKSILNITKLLVRDREVELPDILGLIVCKIKSSDVSVKGIIEYDLISVSPSTEGESLTKKQIQDTLREFNSGNPSIADDFTIANSCCGLNISVTKTSKSKEVFSLTSEDEQIVSIPNSFFEDIIKLDGVCYIIDNMVLKVDITNSKGEKITQSYNLDLVLKSYLMKGAIGALKVSEGYYVMGYVGGGEAVTPVYFPAQDEASVVDVLSSFLIQRDILELDVYDLGEMIHNFTITNSNSEDYMSFIGIYSPFTVNSVIVYKKNKISLVNDVSNIDATIYYKENDSISTKQVSFSFEENSFYVEGIEVPYIVQINFSPKGEELLNKDSILYYNSKKVYDFIVPTTVFAVSTLQERYLKSVVMDIVTDNNISSLSTYLKMMISGVVLMATTLILLLYPFRVFCRGLCFIFGYFLGYVIQVLYYAAVSRILVPNGVNDLKIVKLLRKINLLLAYARKAAGVTGVEGANRYIATLNNFRSANNTDLVLEFVNLIYDVAYLVYKPKFVIGDEIDLLTKDKINYFYGKDAKNEYVFDEEYRASIITDALRLVGIHHDYGNLVGLRLFFPSQTCFGNKVRRSSNGKRYGIVNNDTEGLFGIKADNGKEFLEEIRKAAKNSEGIQSEGYKLLEEIFSYDPALEFFDLIRTKDDNSSEFLFNILNGVSLDLLDIFYTRTVLKDFNDTDVRGELSGIRTAYASNYTDSASVVRIDNYLLGLNKKTKK